MDGIFSISSIQMFSGIEPSITRLQQSTFVRNLLIVTSGTAIAQILGLALSPVISRLYSPAEFGVFGSFNAVLAVISAGVTLEYSQALMLPKDKADAFNLLAISCLVTLLISALCVGVFLAAPARLQSLVNFPNAGFLALLVVAVLVAGFNQAFQSWCVRVKAFKETSSSQVVRSVSGNGIQIGLGSAQGGAFGLVFGSVCADCLATVNLARVVRSDWSALRGDVSWARMKRLAREYVDFPAYAASQNVINALSVGLPVFLLTHYFGIAVAGAYAFAVRILQVPMNFLLRALRQVLFQKACETHHHGNPLLPLYLKTTMGLLAIGIVPSLVLVVLSPQIFAWVFGNKWQVAGEFARYLIIWLLAAFCNLPAVLFARLIRMQRTVFLYDLIMLAARASVLVAAGVWLTALQGVILFSLVGAVMNVVLIILVGRAVKKQERANSLGSISDFPLPGAVSDAPESD